MLVIAGDLDAHAVGLDGEHVDFAAGLNDQSVLEDIIVCDVSLHLEDLESAKIGAHFFYCVDGGGIDVRNLLLLLPASLEAVDRSSQECSIQRTPTE